MGEGSRTVESVWDYPRPPRLERTAQRLVVMHRGITIAETTDGLRVLETSHPPVFYVPPGDIAMEYVRASSSRRSFCEFKGMAQYWTLEIPSEDGMVAVQDAAWSYPVPAAGYAGLRDHLAFYASRVDACTVDGERVGAQAGDFYGGWITSAVKGPFKGAAGTMGW